MRYWLELALNTSVVIDRNAALHLAGSAIQKLASLPIVLRGGFLVLWSRDRDPLPRNRLPFPAILCGDLMSKRVVAVIDDDLSMRTSLARLLRAKGNDCESCGSAEEFLDGFTSSNANCVPRVAPGKPESFSPIDLWTQVIT